MGFIESCLRDLNFHDISGRGYFEFLLPKLAGGQLNQTKGILGI